MRPVHVVFVILLALAALAVWISSIEPPPNATGVAHAMIAGMKQGGDGLQRAEPVFVLGTLFGLLIFGAALSAVYLGVPEAYRSAAFKLGFSICACLLLLSWFGLVWTYHNYIHDPTASGFFLGFPAPTAWLLYGIWLAPFGLIVLYIYGYRRWIFPPEAEEKFKQLMAERSKDADHG
jgi:hypothetical protein